MDRTGGAALQSKLQLWKCAGQKTAICDHEGKVMRCSTKVSCGRNRARMTNTSRNGIGAERSRAISVSHWAHALGLPLLTLKFFSNKACANLLFCHTALQQHKQFFVGSVEVGHQQADSSFPIVACHCSFKANPGGQPHGGSDSITARNNSGLRELQSSQTDFFLHSHCRSPLANGQLSGRA